MVCTMEVKLHFILPVRNFTLKQKCQGNILEGLTKLWGQPSIPEVRVIPTFLVVTSAAELGVLFRSI